MAVLPATTIAGEPAGAVARSEISHILSSESFALTRHTTPINFALFDPGEANIKIPRSACTSGTIATCPFAAKLPASWVYRSRFLMSVGVCEGWNETIGVREFRAYCCRSWIGIGRICDILNSAAQRITFDRPLLPT
jgi:hypothetical protein